MSNIQVLYIMAFILETCIQSAKSNNDNNNHKNESMDGKEIVRKEERKKKENARHVGHTLELIVDDQLRNELDETKHVDGLGKGRNNERVPSSVGPIFVEKRN